MKRTTHPAGLPLLALATGPILVVVGHALSAPIEGTGREYATRFAANRPEHVAGLLLTAVGVLLLVPGLAGVLRVLDGRSTLARVGATLAGVGAAALGVGDGMIALIAGALTRDDLELAARVKDVTDESSLAGLPFQFAQAFVLGLVLLGVALVRIGGGLRWPGVGLVAGAVLVFASGSGGLAAAVTLTPLAIACVALAHALWRLPEPARATTVPAVQRAVEATS